MTTTDLQILKRSLEAIEALKAEYRALDLPYGSKAYAQANDVSHELKRAIVLEERHDQTPNTLPRQAPPDVQDLRAPGAEPYDWNTAARPTTDEEWQLFQEDHARWCGIINTLCGAYGMHCRAYGRVVTTANKKGLALNRLKAMDFARTSLAAHLYSHPLSRSLKD